MGAAVAGYHQASVHVFHGAGHLSLMTRTGEFAATVTEFVSHPQS